MNETVKRGISGTVYILLLMGCTLFSAQSFFVLFGVLMLIAVNEFCNILYINKIASLIIAATIYFLFYKFKFSPQNDKLLLITSLLISAKCILFLFETKTIKMDIASKYAYLIGYVILPFVIITKIAFGIHGFNPKIIISIFILIWTNDTFAYIVGKSIGKTKLFERISPKKTIEGFVGGVIFTVIVSFFISKYFIQGATQIWLIIAVIVGVFGTIGDLVESKFKRFAGVKDSGTIMPGHGGVLDRLDSVIFVAPYIYLFYQILNYVTFS